MFNQSLQGELNNNSTSLVNEEYSKGKNNIFNVEIRNQKLYEYRALTPITDNTFLPVNTMENESVFYEFFSWLELQISR